VIYFDIVETVLGFNGESIILNLAVIIVFCTLKCFKKTNFVKFYV